MNIGDRVNDLSGTRTGTITKLTTENFVYPTLNGNAVLPDTPQYFVEWDTGDYGNGYYPEQWLVPLEDS